MNGLHRYRLFHWRRRGGRILAGALALAAVALARSEDAFLRDLVETRYYTRGQPTAISFTPDGQTALFLRSGPRDDIRALYSLSLATGEAARLVDASALLGGMDEELSPAEKARRERQRLTARGLASYELSKDGRRLLLPLSGRLFVWDLAGRQGRELTAAAGCLDPRWAPDSRRVGYVRNEDVYVVNADTGRENAVTRGGTEAVSYGLAEFVAQEEMARMHGFWWAPDSRSILVERADARGVETWRVNDPMRPDRAGVPQFYPRPGHPNVDVELAVFPLGRGKPVWLQWDRKRYPYVASVTWDLHGGLTFQAMSRDQKDLVLFRVDPATGATRPLISEHDDAWLNCTPGLPLWLDSGAGFVWASEKEAGWQLELRRPDGGLAAVLAPPELGARFGERAAPDLDRDGGQILFGATPDPTGSQVWRTSVADPRPQPVAVAPGLNGAWLGPRGAFILSHSSPDSPTRWVAYRADGSVAGELPSLAEAPPVPRVQYAKVGPDPGWHVKIVRPRNFDASKKYPVIATVYGGPHAQVVRQDLYGSLMAQWLADQGFVVVSADGRGTPGRGRLWERAIYGRFADVPLADQAAALEALGASYREMDLSRVGVTGWSFGGYLSALAVLRRPDVFHAAVAGAPVTDWLDYDTCYTERYLGIPPAADAVYRQNSLIADAPNLRRPLLLIHGVTDDNVFFRHSLKLADALFRAGRPFEFLPLAGFTHMVPDPLVRERLEQRSAEFLRRTLGEPR